MRDSGVVDHRSARTGESADRLRAARYRATASGENVALDGSLVAAQAALMRSAGHRANIVDARFTHVGIGAVRGARGWFVTQLFARPVAPLPVDAGAAIAARIAVERAARGLPPLANRAELMAIAASHAPAIAAGGVDGLTDRVSDDIRSLVLRAVVSTYQIAELAELALPDAALDAAMTELGAAAAADPDTGRVGAVLVIAG
jgi:hypothetical protein